jgi:hypothetical protein
MWAFEQELGPERLARALDRVPPPHRTAYLTAGPTSWVPYETVVIVHQHVADEAGESVEALLDRAVPRAVEHAFSTVWRVLVRFTTDDALIARTPLLYSRTRSKGRMTAIRTAPGEAVAEVMGWPAMPLRDVRALALSIETVLRLAGRADVVVTAEATPGGARFSLRWSSR